MHLSIHKDTVLEGCISQYIRRLYWRDASHNTVLAGCIPSTYYTITVQSLTIHLSSNGSNLGNVDFIAAKGYGKYDRPFLKLHIAVENRGESAYKASVIVTLPDKLRFKQATTTVSIRVINPYSVIKLFCF